MKLVCVWNALLLSLLPASLAQAHVAQSQQSAEPPDQKSPPPPVVLGTKDERIEKAAGFYDKGRFVEAALEFEGLAKEFPQEPSFLFNAAVSRYGAGHHAHTIANTRAYLARKDLQPDDRKEAEAQLAEALRKVVPIRVTVRAPAGGATSVTVVAQHIARSSADLRPELLFPLTLSEQVATAQLDLDPGAWTLRIQDPHYERQERRIELVQGTPSAVEFALAFVPADVDPPLAARAPEAQAFLRGRWAGAWGGVGGGLVIAGLPAAAVAGIRSGNLFDTCTMSEEPIGDCRAALAQATMLRAGGAGMLGAGLGLMVGGLTGLAAGERARKIAWSTEAGVGGALAVVGLIFLGVTQSSFNQVNTSSAPNVSPWGQEFEEQLKPSMRGFIAGAALLGAGLGLGLSATLGLVSPKFLRKRSGVAARWHLQPDGFAVKF